MLKAMCAPGRVRAVDAKPGVVASTVIPCDGTVEIGRLDAVNPPHTLTLVCK